MKTCEDFVCDEALLGGAAPCTVEEWWPVNALIRSPLIRALPRYCWLFWGRGEAALGVWNTSESVESHYSKEQPRTAKNTPTNQPCLLSLTCYCTARHASGGGTYCISSKEDLNGQSQDAIVSTKVMLYKTRACLTLGLYFWGDLWEVCVCPGHSETGSKSPEKHGVHRHFNV